MPPAWRPTRPLPLITDRHVDAFTSRERLTRWRSTWRDLKAAGVDGFTVIMPFEGTTAEQRSRHLAGDVWPRVKG